jgi:uncharacterized integral membrane protein
MPYQYRRRRPSLIRNFWVYRRLIGTAVLLGLMLWFIWANNAPVTVAFPFRLGQYESTLGVVILLSSLLGSAVTFLIMTVVGTMRKLRNQQNPPDLPQANELVEDRPPPDYAAKTSEGFSNAKWSE